MCRRVKPWDFAYPPVTPAKQFWEGTELERLAIAFGKCARTTQGLDTALAEKTARMMGYFEELADEMQVIRKRFKGAGIL